MYLLEKGGQVVEDNGSAWSFGHPNKHQSQSDVDSPTVGQQNGAIWQRGAKNQEFR